MSDDSRDFSAFIRKMAFQHTELYLDDAKRVCAQVLEYYQCRNDAQRADAKKVLTETCDAVGRKISRNRARHQSLTLPECFRVLGNPLSTDLQLWNTVNRISGTARDFLTDSSQQGPSSLRESKKRASNLRSDPPPAA